MALCGVGVAGLAAWLGPATGARDGPPQDERLGIGRAATEQEIARWDIDVGPDGVGLPDGRGTAREGAAIYLATCSACHGLSGREGPNNVLVGRLPGDAFPFATDPRLGLTIGNYWPYATTVFDYINRAMPLDRPGTLDADEVYALVALLLHWNGVVSEDAVMDRGTLPEVVMPSRDRFVPDNRTGGPVIR